MSENWRCEHLPSEHLWSLADHAQSQIEMWTMRRDRAIGQLADRGEVLIEYPTQTGGE